MENPNAYDDDKWSRASMDLRSAVASFWEAGCDLEHIEQDVQGALEDEDVKVHVSISEA